jgi:hypothetical protein
LCDDELFCNGADSCQGGKCATHVGNPCSSPFSCGEAGNACINVWINEIHYDNLDADTGEGVEVAGVAGTDLDAHRCQVVLYNGSDSNAYATHFLTAVLSDQSNGYGTSWLALPSNGMQNGSPDGLALVCGGAVVQFLSYEGTLVAADGFAVGMTSVDIGVSESSSAAVGTSLQLTGAGNAYASFTWAAGVAATPGAPNDGQTFP